MNSATGSRRNSEVFFSMTATPPQRALMNYSAQNSSHRHCSYTQTHTKYNYVTAQRTPTKSQGSWCGARGRTSCCVLHNKSTDFSGFWWQQPCPRLALRSSVQCEPCVETHGWIMCVTGSRTDSGPCRANNPRASFSFDDLLSVLVLESVSSVRISFKLLMWNV